MIGLLTLTTNVRGADANAAKTGAAKGQNMFVYIGTYSQNDSKGIYVYQLDAATGQLRDTGQTAQTTNPSFVTLHLNGRYLYAVNEVGDLNGKPGGGVSAFAIDEQSGALTLLNQQSSKGGAPCHLSVDATGRLLTVANYSGGSIASLPIGEDGRLGEAASFFQHAENGADGQPKQAHAHSVTIDQANRYAVACDLGLDKLFIYHLDTAKSQLIPNDVPFVSLHAGAGPRHFTFHPSNRFGYVINESDSTISAFSYQPERGELKEMQNISTLPAGFNGKNYTADIHIAPSGKFLYGSNRGHDSIAIYSIDEPTGRLTLVGLQSTQGRTPRNFAIDPTGTWLLAANQDSNNIVVFRINAKTGGLTATGQIIEVPAPVCIQFGKR